MALYSTIPLWVLPLHQIPQTTTQTTGLLDYTTNYEINNNNN